MHFGARRAPAGWGPQDTLALLLAPYIPQRVCASLAPSQRTWGPQQSCIGYFLTEPLVCEATDADF